MNQKGRIEWIDTLRCLAMFIVVMGHVYVGKTPDTLRFYIYSFHMPLFFMISGMGYYLQTSKKEYTAKKMLVNKSRSLLWPYFIFEVINIPLLMLIDFVNKGYSNRSIIQLLQGTIYGNLEYKPMPTGPMWFCLVLFLTTMLFFLINKILKKDLHLFIVVIIIGAIGYKVTIRIDDIVFPWYSNTVFVAIVFFLFGYLFMKYNGLVDKLLGNKIRQGILLIVFLFIGYECAKNNDKISMAVSSYGSWILFFGSVIGFSMGLYIISKNVPSNKIVSMVGRNTIVYLALHKNLIAFIKVYSEASNDFMLNHPFIVTCVIFIILIPITFIIEKYLSVLIGKKRR